MLRKCGGSERTRSYRRTPISSLGTSVAPRTVHASWRQERRLDRPVAADVGIEPEPRPLVVDLDAT